MESEPIMSSGCASTLATFSMLCEKLTIPTVHFCSSRRFIRVSAGAIPDWRAIWARLSPSSSRRRHVAMKT
jgi:hypothetical protein